MSAGRVGSNTAAGGAPRPEGIVWVPGPPPGAVHDLIAAQIWGILRHLAAAGLITLGGKGYHGAGEPVITPLQRPQRAGIAEGR